MIIDHILQDRRWVVYIKETWTRAQIGMTVGWTDNGIIVATPDGKPLRYLTDPTPVPWLDILSLHKTQYEAQQHLKGTDDA